MSDETIARVVVGTASGGGLEEKVGIKAAAYSLPVTLASDEATHAVKGAGTAGSPDSNVVTVQGITNGTTIPVTASAGANLNTSALALETSQVGLGWWDLSVAGSTLSYDGSLKTSALTAGKYIIRSTTNCFVNTGPNETVVVTTATGLPLDAGVLVGIIIDGTNDAIAAIKEATAGTLNYKRIPNI